MTINYHALILTILLNSSFPGWNSLSFLARAKQITACGDFSSSTFIKVFDNNPNLKLVSILLILLLLRLDTCLSRPLKIALDKANLSYCLSGAKYCLF